MTFSTIVTQTAGKTGFVLQKYSPQILTVGGVAGVVASTIMIARATLKLEETHEKAEERIETVKGSKALAITNEDASYDEKKYLKDLTAAYTHIVIDYTRLYGPGIALSVASIGMILGGHHIEHQRGVGMVAAYKALETSVNEYRKRVVDAIGEEAEEKIRKNVVSKVSKPIEGLESEGKVEQVTVKRDGHSQFAKFFDESNKNFSKVPHNNLYFLRANQAYAQERLNAYGYLFLSDVYEALGIEQTPTSRLFGWKLDPNSDNIVDFGIYNGSDERKRMFVNGDELAILLDFNVDEKPLWDRFQD